jgi:hypothetical protein
VVPIGFFLHAGTAWAQPVPEVPQALRVPATEILSFSAQARGAQIYRCSAGKSDPASFEWVLVGPEADLFDDAGEPIGKHYAGPTWESKDGSKVVGEVKAKVNSLDPNAVAWLLLGVKTSEGKGVFSGVKSIQRLNTVGGQTPAEGCNRSRLGEESKVPYKAVYYFYTATR